MTAAELAAFDEAVFAAMDGLERTPANIMNRIHASERQVRAAWHRLRRAGRVDTLKVSTGIAWAQAGTYEREPPLRYRMESEADAAGLTVRYIPERPGLDVVTERIGPTLADLEAQHRRR